VIRSVRVMSRSVRCLDPRRCGRQLACAALLAYGLGSSAGAQQAVGAAAEAAASPERPEAAVSLDAAGSLDAAVLSQALPGLSPEEQRQFFVGRTAFEDDKDLFEGLGPLFNESSCSRCHNRGGTGGSGFQVAILGGRLREGRFDPLLSLSQLATTRVRQAIPACRLSAEGEPVPPEADVVARRRTTALFGLGLVEATPDSTFITLAERGAAAVRGRAARVLAPTTGKVEVGRFGWKAQFPSLVQFSAAAFRNELGITNPLFPEEQAPLGQAELLAACDVVPGLEDDGRGVLDAATFIRLLAPVAPRAQDPLAKAGAALFTKVGCDACHVRTLRSGPHEVAALSERDYHPYSDFLLHDMGSLADGVAGDGDAGPHEMRTAPLWGLHLVRSRRLLHDGRARSMADAIAQHEGQGALARAAYGALSEREKQALLAFLETL
jgi:CxxC motif-containing protein (DUF1111 family)